MSDHFRSAADIADSRTDTRVRTTRCDCGELHQRCCPDCVRGRCEDCGDTWDWRDVEFTERTTEEQATVDAFLGGETA